MNSGIEELRRLNMNSLPVTKKNTAKPRKIETRNLSSNFFVFSCFRDEFLFLVLRQADPGQEFRN